MHSQDDNHNGSEPSATDDLVRLLRTLEPRELQPGLVERCWEEFRVLAELPEPSVPEPAPLVQPAPRPDRRPADLAPPPPDDLRERLGFVRPRRIVSARP